MKKRIFTLMLLLLEATFAAEANPVDLRCAREVAVKFMNANSEEPLRGAEDLQLVTTYRTESDDAAFHVFNTPNGFVIVSADNCATPILGYSNERQFDVENVPIQLQDYLQGFVEQIQYAIENQLEADEQTIQQWELVRTIGWLTNIRTNETVEPLITTTWSQGCYYNAMCPEDADGQCGRVWTGCVATAMAQVLRYWGYPEHGTGSYSYTPTGYPEQSVDFGATTYDWGNMPNSLDEHSSYEQINAVATLMWHCGVSVNMYYGATSYGSAGWLDPPSLINYFNYSDEMSLENTRNFTASSWKAKLRDCLNLNRPLFYIGYTPVGGHAFVCDGYDNNDMFHFNWGWGGMNDGYYTLSAMIGDLSSNTAIFNIHPQGETTNYTINVSVNNEEYGTASGSGIFAHGDIVTLAATANNGYGFCYWEENGEMVSTNPNYSFGANYNRDLVAVFDGPYTVTLSNEEGGTVSGGGSFYYGEPCLATAVADEGYIFTYWTDDGNVVSHNPNYTFAVTGETHLIAHFAVLTDEIIIFDDIYVKEICLTNWDMDGDGLLSYDEAAMVTSIGEAFKSNLDITSFDELQYFTNLTAIDNFAFRYCRNLALLTFPNAITSIGNYAFEGCYNLSGSLTIPSTVTSIGNHAFSSCRSLTSLVIPNAVTIIDDYAFSGCRGLNSMYVYAEVPPTVGLNTFDYVGTNIQVWVPCDAVETYQASEVWNRFSNILCMSSGNITIISDPLYGGEIVGAGSYEGGACCAVVATPNEGYIFAYWTENGNVVSYDSIYSFIVTGDRLFTAHFLLGGNIVFADANVKNICISHWDTDGDGELSYLEASRVTSLGVYFKNNLEITSFEELQYFINLTSIGASAFSGCSGLTGNLVIPNSVTTIGYMAFFNCSGFTGDLVIPNSVAKIEEYAFYNCSGFTGNLTLGNSMTTIGSSAFSGCSGLTGSLTIPNSVISIGNSAFSGCSGFTGSLIIPNSVTSIDNSTFYNCSGFTGGLTLGNSVTSIEYAAFYNCSGFTGSLTIGDSVTTIGGSAFSGCSGFTGSLTLGNSLTSIGYNAFYNCSGFTGSLTIPDSVITIGGSAFRNCSSFTGSLTIGNSVTTIGNSAFYGCSGFTGSLIIPNSVTSIGNSAFYGCSGFTDDLVIPNSVTAIGDYAFYNCIGFMGSLTLGNSVTTIGNSAFSGCNGFTGSLTIPNSVTTIGSSAFYGCNGFTGNLTIGSSVVSMGNYAFYNCSGFSGSLTIGDSVTTIGTYAFGYCRNFTSMTLLPETPPTAVNVFFNGLYGIPVHVPCGALTAYQEASGWSSFTNYREDCLLTQTVTLVAGWNWISLYVEVEDPVEALQMLETALGDNATQISASEIYTEYFGEGVWIGDLDEVGITNEQMYMVEVVNDCEIELEGVVANPVDHAIVIYPGWNWIGFPSSEELNLEEALADFEAEDGDQLTEAELYTEYGFGMWIGNVATLVPGQGYMYFSNSTQPKTLVFSTTSKGKNVFLWKRKE